MIEPGDGLRFAFKEARRVRGSMSLHGGDSFAADHLNSNLSLDTRILGKVDLPHATAANHAEQMVAAYIQPI